jgi:hypothetical protein
MYKFNLHIHLLVLSYVNSAVYQICLTYVVKSEANLTRDDNICLMDKSTLKVASTDIVSMCELSIASI